MAEDEESEFRTALNACCPARNLTEYGGIYEAPPSGSRCRPCSLLTELEGLLKITHQPQRREAPDPYKIGAGAHAHQRFGRVDPRRVCRHDVGLGPRRLFCASIILPISSAGSRQRQAEAILVAFDVLEVDGQDVRPEPLEERRKRLAKLLSRKTKAMRDGIQISEAITGDGAAIFRHACWMDLEGIVSKHIGSRYVSGRKRAWKNPEFERR